MRRKGGRGMSEWKKVKLGEVCDTQYGFTASTVQQDTGTQFLRITDIVPQLIDWNTVPYCQIQEKDREKYLLHKGDIVVARTGATVGYAKYIKEDVPAVFASYLVRLLVNSIDVDRHYVGLCVESNLFKEYIQSISNGSAQPNANAQMISSFEINLPPLSTQHRIATILSRYDSLIENYQKQIKLLEEAAQRLYKEWFVDLRFSGHENTNIIDGVPEGWEKKTIDDVTCKITTGLNPRKNFVLGKGSNYYVTIKNMADNTLFLDDRCDRVDNEALEKINKRSDLKIGDILFSGIGTIGRVALVDIPTNNWNVSESVFTLRANDIVTKEFLYLMLLSPDMQNYCQSNAHGAAQKGIRMADLKAYSFNLPPFGVIQKFTNLVTPTIKKVSSIRNQIRLLTEARDRLLPRLMNGEIAV